MKLSREAVGPFTKYTFTRTITDSGGRESAVNVYRLGETLIDSASRPAAPLLIDALQADPPKQIVLTHQHEDHIGGLGDLVAAFGDVPVHAPVEHIEIIRAGYEVPPYRVAYWGEAPGHPELIAYDASQSFAAGGYEMEVLNTPGHTPGHKSFAVRAGGEFYVISGDLYLAPRLPNAFFETSVPDMISSLRKLLALDTDFTLCPSHGGPFRDGAKRVRGLLAWYEKEMEAITAIHARHPDWDYNDIFKERHNFYNLMELESRGELSRAALIRGVIDPVRELPAEPIVLDESLYAASRARQM